jgi:plasmid stabilization system protein ParE
MIQVLDYISEQGFPYTASKIILRMEAFVNSLGTNPEKYEMCENEKFNNAGFRCAIFENTYVFVYKIESNIVKLIRVIHGKNIK